MAVYLVESLKIGIGLRLFGSSVRNHIMRQKRCVESLHSVRQQANTQLCKERNYLSHLGKENS